MTLSVSEATATAGDTARFPTGRAFRGTFATTGRVSVNMVRNYL
jgi:hypothetical protein